MVTPPILHPSSEMRSASLGRGSHANVQDLELLLNLYSLHFSYKYKCIVSYPRTLLSHTLNHFNCSPFVFLLTRMKDTIKCWQVWYYLVHRIDMDLSSFKGEAMGYILVFPTYSLSLMGTLWYFPHTDSHLQCIIRKGRSFSVFKIFQVVLQFKNLHILFPLSHSSKDRQSHNPSNSRLKSGGHS